MAKVSQGAAESPAVDSYEKAEPDKPAYEYSDDEDDSLSTSSDESDGRPPPVMEIEKSAEFTALKSAFVDRGHQQRDRSAPPVDKSAVVERLGKDTLANITSTFEGLKDRKEEPQAKTERTPLTVVDKERYSQYKQKFEHIGEEEQQKARRRSSLGEEIKGAGKEILSQTKEMFERIKQLAEQTAPSVLVDVGLSPEERKRIKETFSGVQETEERSNCDVCGRVVYPMERLQLEKKAYHKGCFRCCKCLKNLSVQNYSAHQGRLYCKVHMAQLFHPEAALAFDASNETTGAEPTVDSEEDDDEGEYAVVRRPKALDPSVVKSSLKAADDFGQITSVSNRRSILEQIKDAKPERKADLNDTLTSAGSLKEKLSKFTSPGQSTEESAKSQREQIVLEVGAKEIKSKWETAAVETADLKTEDRSDELDAIKAAVNVKERFKERRGDQAADASLENRQSGVEADLDTSFSRESKARFLKGAPVADESPQPTSRLEEDIKFAELGSVKKRFETMEEKPTERGEVVDVRCSDMGNIKAAFEASQAQKEEADRLQEMKKIQIESEFKMIKKEKRRLQEKERRQSEEIAKNEVKMVPYEDPTDVRQCNELSSIKQRFEQGFVDADDAAPKTTAEPDVEIKVAPKARQKFKKLAEEAPKAPVPVSSGASVKESKWNREAVAVPEPINRRQVDDDDSGPEQPEDFEVKNLLSKFKNIAEGANTDGEQSKGPKPQRVITPPPEGYKAEVESMGKERLPGIVVAELSGREPIAVKTDAKNLKQKFEQSSSARPAQDSDMSAEKRKMLEDEFRRLKEEREQFRGQLAADQEQQSTAGDAAAVDEDKQDLAVAAEHAHKMRAKWEKIQKKEAKKAQKSAQLKRTPKKAWLRSNDRANKCPVCSKTVYLAERFECDGVFYHRPCFKCKLCQMSLRLDTFVHGSDGVYCKTHYRMLFNNPNRTVFDGRPVTLIAPQRA